MKTRTTLYAEEGMILTDGIHYGTVVTLAAGEGISAWREIPKAEYDATAAEEGRNV